MATIVLGVSGSIAAYKAADLAARLVKDGHEVYAVLTPGAAHFVGPLTFSALTGHPCPVHVFDEPFPGEIAHIHLATIADLFVVAPASMDFMAKLACGLADDMLSASVLATAAPVLLAPGMNTVMWSHPATRANVARLGEFGYKFVDPISGRLACRAEGLGKMAEVDTLFETVRRHLARGSAWSGKTILVTAGPTREPIDPVRYLTNRSSGRMGYAVAETAAEQGARVVLVSGPAEVRAPQGRNIEIVRVHTAAEMEQAALEHLAAADVVVAAAAVADYRPAAPSGAKLKKGGESMSLELVRNPDILEAMGRRKRPDQVLVGFAAETGDPVESAAAKMGAKNLDFVVANDVTREGAGFDGDTNIVTILGPRGTRTDLPLMPKREVAERLLELIAAQKQIGTSPAPQHEA